MWGTRLTAGTLGIQARKLEAGRGPCRRYACWRGQDFASSLYSSSVGPVSAWMGGPATRQGGAPMSTIAVAVRTADRIDHWIRQHVVPYGHGTYSSQSMWNPARNRRVGLLAIGQCLKDQYDALATPIPPHLAALVKQLETQERARHAIPQPLVGHRRATPSRHKAAVTGIP